MDQIVVDEVGGCSYGDAQTDVAPNESPPGHWPLDTGSCGHEEPYRDARSQTIQVNGKEGEDRR